MLRFTCRAAWYCKHHRSLVPFKLLGDICGEALEAFATFFFFFPTQISDKIVQPMQLERAFSSFIFLHPEIMSVTDSWRVQ